jgi:DNA polymerase-4
LIELRASSSAAARTLSLRALTAIPVSRVPRLANKFLAKIASDYRKPNGRFVIMPDEAEAFVAILSVAKFHGLGPKTAAKMRALGIETGADLRLQTLSFLQDRFGKAGSWYYDIARGWDDRPVQPDRERKSSGSETTFPEDFTDPRSNRGRRDCDGQRCLGLVREGKFSRSDRDGEDQIGRLSVVHS